MRAATIVLLILAAASAALAVVVTALGAAHGGAQAAWGAVGDEVTASFARSPWSWLGWSALGSLGLAFLLSCVLLGLPGRRAASGPEFSRLERHNVSAAVEEVRRRIEECLAPSTPRIIPLLDELIRGATTVNASDIHITPLAAGLRLTYRVHGTLHQVAVLDQSIGPLLCTRIKVLARMDVFVRGVPQDGRLVVVLDGGSIEARVSTLPTEHGERVVLRLVQGSRTVPELDALGFGPTLNDALRELLTKPQGLLFLTGPVGSGKTTTLYSALKHIASRRGSTTALVTLEDPIELQLPFATQTQMNAKTGMTFSATLRSVLRQDPNVLMLGEIRDRETADIAMQAGLTGHLILTTVHGQSAAGVFARLSDMGVQPFILASATLGCLSQRLVRTLCTACRREAEPNKLLVDRLVAQGLSAPSGVFYEPVGCQFCEGLGFSGRTPIAELLVSTAAVRQCVCRRAASNEIHGVAVSEGMSPLLVAGIGLAGRGVTSLAEVLRVAG